MQLETQAELIDRLRTFITSNGTEMVEHERFNPVSEYWMPERHKSELGELFPRLPLVVGHASQLEAVGDHFVDRLAPRDILVVHLGDEGLGGFVPRSEDVSVLPAGDQLCGVVERLTNGADPEGEGLRPVQVESRHGLVWALLGGDHQLDVRRFLGPALDDELGNYDMSGYALERDHFFDEGINWKSVIDGFLENYHVRFLHKDTLSQYLRSNVHTFDAFGSHIRLVVPKQSIERVLDQPFGTYDATRYFNVVYQIFPNTVIGWVGDHFESWVSYPDRAQPSRSNTRFSIIAPRGRENDHEFWDRSMSTVMAVIPAEDFEMSRLMQRGFPALAQPYHVFGRNEGALQHFHRELERILGPAPAV